MKMKLLSLCVAGLVAAGAAPWAQAQSAGNPKGSVAPSTQGNSAKAPANPARTVDTGRSDPLDDTKGPVDARPSRTPQRNGGIATRDPQGHTAPSAAQPPRTEGSQGSQPSGRGR